MEALFLAGNSKDDTGIQHLSTTLFNQIIPTAKKRLIPYLTVHYASMGWKNLVPSLFPNFDIEENLYIAHFGGGAIIIVKPDGTILTKIKVPGKKPSNIEFAGDDLKTMYITEDETNCLYRIKVDVPGLPLFSSPK